VNAASFAGTWRISFSDNFSFNFSQQHGCWACEMARLRPMTPFYSSAFAPRLAPHIGPRDVI